MVSVSFINQSKEKVIMKVFKVTVEVWVKGRGKQDALDKLIDDMDYLAGLEDDYLNVVAFEHPTEAKFDKEATQRLKGEQA